MNSTPQKHYIQLFFPQKKKISPDIPKWSFMVFETEPETPFGNRKFFFLKILLTRIVFWGEIYRELPCRRNHYIIISGSRSKVEKTMKSSDFSNYDCDPEIMLKWLQHHGNLQWILPQKTLWSTCFPEKKKFRQISQNGRFPILTLNPFRESKFFFFSKFNLLVSFFGVKYTGNYHVVRIIP